jgi:hypothetical protein
MRAVPSVDQECIDMFALEAPDVARANAVLASLGRDSMASVASVAMELPERCVDAVLWRALASPAPWPWLGAELNATLSHRCEQHEGRKLFCALIARQSLPDHDPSLAPKDLDLSLSPLGAVACSTMASPHDMALLGSQRRLALAQSMESGPCLGLPQRADRPALGAWAMPILYTPERHGPYSSMDDRSRALLSASLAEAIQARLALNEGAGAPRDVLLGFGPMSSILEMAPLLCAPMSLRAKIHQLCSTLMLSAPDLACSVSFHRDSEREWLRVALRPVLTGFCLSGLDWPCGPGGHEEAFDHLLDTLSACNIEWCHQVESVFDAQICPSCGEPIYPTPTHAPWREAFLEAGAPPDGSHRH